VRRLLLSIAGVVVLAGCAAGQPATPDASQSNTPAVTAQPSRGSTGPSDEPSSSGASPSPSSNLVLPHDDPGLEARLPGAVNGKTLFKLSVGPVSSAGNAGAEPVKAMVKEIGDGSGNFSLAFANEPTDPSYNFFALRVPGAKGPELVAKYAALTVADTRGAEADQATLAGKSVTHVTAPDNQIGDVWFYAIEDTLFGVQAGSPERATELLKLLP
jgi:hypothetical protein